MRSEKERFIDRHKNKFILKKSFSLKRMQDIVNIDDPRTWSREEFIKKQGPSAKKRTRRQLLEKHAENERNALKNMIRRRTQITERALQSRWTTFEAQINTVMAENLE